MSEIKQANATSIATSISSPVTLTNEFEQEPIRTLEVDGHQITLLGTAHISQASADKVKELIATGEFDAVAIELCPSRHKAIVNPDLLSKMDLFQVIHKGQASMVTASLALGAFQQRMAERLGIEPGLNAYCHQRCHRSQASHFTHR